VNVDNVRVALRASFFERCSVIVGLGFCPGCGPSVDLRGGGAGKAFTRGWRGGWKTSSRGTDSPRIRVAFSNCLLRSSASGTSTGVSGGEAKSEADGVTISSDGRIRGDRASQPVKDEAAGSAVLEPDEEAESREGDEEEECE
jgi:hypothetical protein